MELPQDVMNHIKTFLPPHPLQNKIKLWSRRDYFYKWYFSDHWQGMQKKKDKIKRFIDRNDFWIKMSGLSNEDAVKLKHRAFLDNKRMKEKLKQINIKIYQVKTITHIPSLNKHGNFSEVYFNDQEIIY
jgi:hypothetical protein